MKTYVFFNDTVTEYAGWPGKENIPIDAYAFESLQAPEHQWTVTRALSAFDQELNHTRITHFIHDHDAVPSQYRLLALLIT